LAASDRRRKHQLFGDDFRLLPPEETALWCNAKEMSRCTKELLYISFMQYGRRGREPSPTKGQGMSKNDDKSNETVEPIEVPARDPGKTTDQLSAAGEKGIEQSKEAFGKIQSGAEDGQPHYSSR
jgi:hypothetical protein